MTRTEEVRLPTLRGVKKVAARMLRRSQMLKVASSMLQTTSKAPKMTMNTPRTTLHTPKTILLFF